MKMKTHNSVTFFLRYILVFAVFMFSMFPVLLYCREENLSIDIYALLIFGGLYRIDVFDIMTMLRFFVPNLFIIFVLSDFMRSQCAVNYVYVFTRAAKKSRWLFHEAFSLFLHTAALFLWTFVLVLFCGKLASLSPIAFDDFLKMILFMYFLNLLTIYVFVFLQNVLSMKHGSTQAFFFVSCLYVVPLSIISTFWKDSSANTLLYIVIPANQMYMWHADRISNGLVDSIVSEPIAGFLLLLSFFVLLISIFVIYQIYRFMFLKKDMLELIKE